MKVTHISLKRYSFNSIFEGFENLEETKNASEKLGLDIGSMVIIYIFDAYYIVGFEDYCKQCIVNKEYFLYNKDGLWRHRLMRNKYKPIPKLINGHSMKNINPRIYNELIEVYPQTRCFIYENNEFIEYDTVTYNHYYVLLGLFFKDKYYTLENIRESIQYFKHIDSYIHFFLKYPFIESINPFKQLAKFNGKEYNYKYVYKDYQTSFEIPNYLLK